MKHQQPNVFTELEIPATTPQGDLCRDAATIVEGDRNGTYGEPHEDFARTVGQLNALGYRGPGGRLLLPRDWAVMANAAKQSRLVATPDHHDSVMDVAGYAGCYWDCVVNEGDPE